MTRKFAIVAIGLFMAGCPPQPKPEPKPTPEPTPTPAPTRCQSAYQRAQELHCDVGGAMFIPSCERHEAEGGALAYHADCMETAKSCEAFEACRGR